MLLYKKLLLMTFGTTYIHLMLHEFSYKDDVHVVGPHCIGWDICSTVWCLAVGGWLESSAELWTL